jgi:hypothetical protein
MLLPYCLFHMGASAMLLSTSPVKARFRLKFIVRTLTAAVYFRQEVPLLCITKQQRYNVQFNECPVS